MTRHQKKELEKQTETIEVLHVKDVFSQNNFKDELKRIGTEKEKNFVNPSIIGQVGIQEESVEHLEKKKEKTFRSPFCGSGYPTTI